MRQVRVLLGAEDRLQAGQPVADVCPLPIALEILQQGVNLFAEVL